MAKERLTWVDATKGFLMILVVIGHYGGPMPTEFPLIKYIYWFHMPAFFLMSGLFFKPILDKIELKSAIHKRFMQLMVPYLFFLLLLAFFKYGIMLADGSFTVAFLREDLIELTIGGRFLRGEHGVFWFVTVMFATFLLFLWVTRFKRWVQFAILAGCYILAQIEGSFAMSLAPEPDNASMQVPMIWNLDVALIAIVYFALGYYFKTFWMNIPKSAIFVSFTIVLLAMTADNAELIDYHLSLKFLRYDHFVLDLLIPIAMTIVVLGVFQQLTALRRLLWLEKIESHSISIMYLHIFFGFLVRDYLPYNLFTYFFAGLFAPILLSILIPKTIPLGEILIGRFKPTKTAQTN